MPKIRLTKEEFIKRSNTIHNFKYIYDKVVYLNNKEKVIITCPIHGDFNQVTKAHMTGQGCSKCAGLLKLSREEFITRSIDIHGNKYIYDKVNYINIMAKVIITCPTHGDFEQVCHSHLSGRGCKKCSGKERLDNAEYIRRAIKVHGNKYDYSLIEYESMNAPIPIICPTNGEFRQTPTNHLSGQDCPKCSKYKIKSKGELLIEDILVKNNIKFSAQYNFLDLKFINELYFDFAILDENNNLKSLLEFNGKQHYKYVKFYHKNNEGFEIHKQRDKLKEDYCIKNNIPLNIIKYNEDINFKLKEILRK